MSRDSRVDAARISVGVVVVICAVMAIAVSDPTNLSLWGVVGIGLALLLLAVLAARRSRRNRERGT